MNGKLNIRVVWLFIAVLLLTLVIASFAFLPNVGAATTGREDACHTYNVFGHQDEGINGEDAVFCGFSSNVSLKDDGEDTLSDMITAIVTTIVPTEEGSPTDTTSTQSPTAVVSETPDAPTKIPTDTATDTSPTEQLTQTPEPTTCPDGCVEPTKRVHTTPTGDVKNPDATPGVPTGTPKPPSSETPCPTTPSPK